MSQGKSKLEKALETAPLKVQDDSLKENASNASGAGLEVRVTRTYDGVGVHNGKDSCQWCLDRCGENMTLEEAYEKGAFQRHPGCGCIIEYISNKGIRTIQTGKYTGWNFANELENRKSIGLDEGFFADELVSRVAPYLDMDADALYTEAKNGGFYKSAYKQMDSLTRPQLEKAIRSYIREAEEHEWKMQNPQNYMFRSDPNNPVEVKIALNDWNNHKIKNSRLATIGIKLWRNKYGKGL